MGMAAEKLEQSDYAAARDILRNAGRVVVLTGAGISAASGVPISAVNHSDTSFLTTVTTKEFESDPATVWRLHLGLRERLAWCPINPAHEALAKYARSKPHVLLTQNIDGLHEVSGHPKVLALHGTLWANRCTACGKVREDTSLEYPGNLPRSPCCNALERPHIVWIGDCLDRGVLGYAFSAVGLCQALLVVGTSAHVAPVSRFAFLARERGAKVIEVNPEPDGLVPANITIREKAEIALPYLLDV